jgi:hypothetical protein
MTFAAEFWTPSLKRSGVAPYDRRYCFVAAL